MILKLFFLFGWMGSANSALHMELPGKGKGGADKTVILFVLTARSGDGPYIPCMLAILLAKKLASGEIYVTGVYS